jgi:hypothetical protein
MRRFKLLFFISLFLSCACGGGTSGGSSSLLPQSGPGAGLLPALVAPTSPATGLPPTLASWVTANSGEAPRIADAFVDTIGVNTHLHYDSNSPYNARYAQFEPLLIAMGIRHLRDGLTDTTYQAYYDRLNQLGLAGIHATLITRVGQSAALLQSYPSRVANAFEAYEGPNEYDTSGDPQWSTNLAAFMKTLYQAVKSDGATAGYPVIAPALTSAASQAALGNQSSNLDFGNMHNYFSGFNPGTPGWGSVFFGAGYGSIAYNIGAEEQVSGSKPIITTETGYCTESNTTGAVSPVIQGRYVPRMFLEQFNAGVKRTFEYEFADEGTGYYSFCGLTTFGLTPKPAYYALSNMIHLLRDQGPTFTPISLPYKLSGSTSNVAHTLLQKRNGVYYLALWIEQPSWDPNAMRQLTVAPQTVTLTLPSNPLVAAMSTLDDAGTMTTSVLPMVGSAASVSLSDRVTVISFALPGVPTTLH